LFSFAYKLESKLVHQSAFIGPPITTVQDEPSFGLNSKDRSAIKPMASNLKAKLISSLSVIFLNMQIITS
jgi:hypothetical protein